MTMAATHRYPIGTVVLARPNWPTRPAFGIWTSDVELVTVGRPAKISEHRSVCSGVPQYGVCFDRDGDGTFNDASWPLDENEIVEVITEARGEVTV